MNGLIHRPRVSKRVRGFVLSTGVGYEEMSRL